MKRMLILICALTAQITFATEWYPCILYHLKDNTNLVTWITNPAKEPWLLVQNSQGLQLKVWDVAKLGPKPTLQMLASNEVAAVAWWANYQYTIKETPQWTSLTNDITAANTTLTLYDLTALTNSIAQVTDANTKTALNEVKKCIKQAHDEAQAIHKEVKDLKTILGKYLQVEP